MAEMTMGPVLQAWRRRVSPDSAGLPVGDQARRTPGLRRAELATLAGVSTDYIKRMEQDRARPSIDVIRALARALRLNREEYDLLARLAGHHLPPDGTVPRHVTPGVLRMAERLTEAPLAVYDLTWTLLTANRAWARLFQDPDTITGRRRNSPWLIFATDDLPVRIPDFERHEQSLVADLRETASRYPADPRIPALVAELRRVSDRFAALWEQPVVARHGGQRKTVMNPLVGEVTLDCEILTVHDAELRLVLLTAEPGSPDAAKMATLTAR
ncbi:helix-turn-helix transcriptional regulator [Actinoplanes sp. LDG1-06]|uniref:Helix-turn-helix transcriptional regulator n=1 Tax=Paractinoplanes ovalisporus TaxID=2810368 RepID=A0ABS2AS50_9ACTN|nr:helix-turn-helix transcriptional regulator [Actinoplanes ovalisporus]MBM2622670.1 helix-turn-helix transcriptional regulator [Actinoplanes ovalisporus]